MTTLYAKFRAKPGSREEVRRLVLGYATTVRSEPGNELFEPYVQGNDPDAIFVLERYRSRREFETHLASVHNARFNATISALIVGGTSTLVFLSSLVDDDPMLP